MRQLVHAAIVLAVSAVPTACGSAPVADTGRTIVPTVVSTELGRHVSPLTWGQAGPWREGVGVTVAKPVLVSDPLPPAGPERLGQPRRVACELLVSNTSRGDVRVGIAVRSGVLELPSDGPDPMVIKPRTSALIRRVVLAPVTPISVTVHVAATVDRVPVPVGWTYAGDVG